MASTERRLRIALIVGMVALTMPLAFVGTAQAADGTWERLWGNDVIQSGAPGDAGTEAEICTVAANCKSGTGGTFGGEFDQPRGVAVDASGNVYVADESNNRIQKFDSSGNFLRAWGKDVIVNDDPGDPTGFEICTVASECKAGLFGGGLGGELSQPQDVAVDGAGNVYVVGADQRVQKFDSDGTWERAWGKDLIQSGRPGNLGTGFEICTVAADCNVGDLSGDLGGEFRAPNGVAVDASGNVYVADEARQRIQKFESDGDFVRLWGNDVVREDLTGDVDPDGFEICTVAADCKTGVAGVLGGHFNAPRGIALDGDGNAYVGDLLNHRVQKFDADGNWERAWGKDVDGSQAGTGFEVCTVAASCQQGLTTGALGGEFVHPIGIDTDGDGDVYVADRDNSRVQKFDSSGSFLRTWGTNVIQSGKPGDLGAVFEVCTVAADCQAGQGGTLGGQIPQPYGLGADASGNVYVTTFGAQRIEKFADPAAPPAITVSIGDVTVTEGTGGKTRANFFATLSGPSAATVTVNFATQDGTATAPSDYGALSGTKSFAPGVVSKRIQVPVVPDGVDESNETFDVVLSDASGATITDGEAIGTINDDDPAAAISIGDASVVEGPAGTAVAARFRVTMSSASSSTVTVQWSTADDSATAPPDYRRQLPATVTFDPGQTAKTVTVKVFGDGAVEPDETFFVNLASSSNATVSDGQGVGTITNDD